MPPIALLHYVTAGVIVALAAPPRLREVRLLFGQSAKAPQLVRRGRVVAPKPQPTPAWVR